MGAYGEFPCILMYFSDDIANLNPAAANTYIHKNTISKSFPLVRHTSMLRSKLCNKTWKLYAPLTVTGRKKPNKSVTQLELLRHFCCQVEFKVSARNFQKFAEEMLHRRHKVKVNPEKHKPAETKNEEPSLPDPDDDDQGFAGWLRSADGATYMRLFVLSNSLVVFLTYGWPQIKQSFEIIHSFLTE